ncbi:MFS transporter [Stappia sp.]|uniref:MFS transporter n=1 Tax=Stappia sp. TaxID=1870903 RepID=UPI0032D9A937
MADDPATLRGSLILAAGAMTVMSGAAIAPALGRMHADLSMGTGEGVDRLVLILPAIVILFLGPAIGHLASRVPPRIFLCASLVVLAVVGAIGGLASGYTWLFLTRTILGLATAAVLCAATAAILRFYDGPARGRMMSAQTACNTVSGVVFIVCGGLLATVDWRLAFLVYLFALPVAALAWREEWGATTGRTIDARPASGIGHDLPLLALVVLAMGGFYLLPTQVPFLHDRIDGPAQAALVIGAGTLASAPFAMLSPRAAQRIGRLPTSLAGIAVMAMGNLMMVLATGPLIATVAAVLIGGGFGLILPLAILMVMERAEPGGREAKSGWVASALYCGQVFAVAFATLLHGFGAVTPFAVFAFALSCGLLAVGVGAMTSIATWRRASHKNE